jgi:hypothetical protein
MLASLLYLIARLLVDLLSVRDREQAEFQAEVLACGISCGFCNGRCIDRGGVRVIGWSWRRDIPWRCRRLVIGTGAEGGFSVTDEVRKEAQLRNVELLSLPTRDAIAILNGGGKDTNAILHVTC